jgi:hypothetical protein
MRKLYLVTLAAGIWLMIGPFVLNFGPLVDQPAPAVSENLVLGILVCSLSIVALTGGITARGIDGLLLLFGLWVIGSPLLYGQWTFDAAEMANTTLAGAAIVLIAILELISFARQTV